MEKAGNAAAFHREEREERKANHKSSLCVFGVPLRFHVRRTLDRHIMTVSR
jgi:hypothetical protein